MMNRSVRLAFSFVSAGIFLVDLALGQFSSASEAASYLVSKREFRGAWIATVTNLDWPTPSAQGSGGNYTQQQKNELVSLLDKLKDANFNAVVFQVRTECDALYNSPYEPWSFWLTGSSSLLQGIPPNPLYDPLEFAVAEAHKRGMELHAWFNPYRAVRPSTYTRAASHVSNTHPEWILNFPTGKILDPGLPAVRDYVAMVVSDIVRRYDVDGIHADDYFYPYPDGSFPGIINEDDSTYAHFNPDSLPLASWRRENVNKLLKQIRDSVQTIKPHVKFGMSPFGIWRPNNPPGISGLDAYNTIYCDAITWLQKKYVDYIAPQLYWAFGGGQDYGKLQSWWADSANANGRHVYTGNATYRIGTTFGSAAEIANQINYNRGNPKVQGSIQFRTLNVTNNLGGISDLLKSDVFLYASVIPTMNWKPDATTPNAPLALSSTNVGPNTFGLAWTAPPPAVDGDTATRYGVYRFTTPTPQPADVANGRSLISLSGGASVIPRSIVDTVGVQFYYAVSALDRNNNESPLSTPVSFAPPGVIPPQPSLAYPANGEQNYPKGAAIRWNTSSNALAYLIELDSTQTFGPASMLVRPNITDTVMTPPGLVAQKTYYWRVAAGNQVGTSGYSDVFSFKTGWPLAPLAVSPNGAVDVARNPTFTWTRSAGTSFHVVVTDVQTFPQVTVLDTTVSDTTFTSNKTLAAFNIYGWRVAASNPYGSSDWSAEARFRTTSGTFAEAEEGLPTEYSLSQNYPNPFNPITTIRIAIPVGGYVTLRVYDILGRDLATLVEEELTAGIHTYRFDGSSLPSGTYIYVLTSGEIRIAKKMMLLK